ncbi:conserved repeat domain-containing protein [Sphingomonas guangdongensis]|uniref:Conserved repeat domain-containing protein n=1 Tax=Sphingomonas guangdongensis TaxID=1141890 RepID=A0A285QCA8_9SPHN|nr:DUF11 domain-containing protein [Sphingomonas guangdongensis]SOB79466.1 conserved repeat domain-containing protein [Sphingomonas guangdongensis]
MTRLLSGTAAITIATVAAPVLAAGPLQVSASVMVEAKERGTDGAVRVKLVPASRVVPGDRMTLVVAYRNTGGQPLSNVVIANPVPAALMFQAAAPGSPAPEVSADGKTFTTLSALRVAGPAGPRAAKPADVTHVRWRMTAPIAPGAEGRFAFNAVLK